MIAIVSSSLPTSLTVHARNTASRAVRREPDGVGASAVRPRDAPGLSRREERRARGRRPPAESPKLRPHSSWRAGPPPRGDPRLRELATPGLSRALPRLRTAKAKGRRSASASSSGSAPRAGPSPPPLSVEKRRTWSTTVGVSLFEIEIDCWKLFDPLNGRSPVKCLEDSRGKVHFPRD